MEKGLRLVLATALISGVSVFLNRFGVLGMDASLFTTLKNLFVALLLLALLLALKEWRTLATLSRREWLSLSLIGLIGGSLPFLLFFTGLKMTTATQGSLVRSTMFVWVALLAGLFLKERISAKMALGGILLLLGNILLLNKAVFVFGVGEALILASTLLWAGEIVLAKRLLSGSAIPGRVVALGRMGFGSLFLLAFVVSTGRAPLLATMGVSSWLWVLVTGLLLFGYVLTFYEGLKSVSASVAAAILLVGSVITIILESLWTGIVGWPQAIGVALLLLGAFILGSRTSQPRDVRALP